MWKNRIVGAGTENPKKLTPNPKNWRKHPKNQAQALEGALEEIGWLQDVIINQRTGRLIDGHLRVELAIRNKEKSVPVKYVDLSEEEEEKALITLDPITSMAEADKDILNSLIESCKTDNEKVKALLQDIAEKEKLLVGRRQAEEDDYEPPAEIETDIQRGDIFQLGRHRVMCGDSTCREDVERLMDGKKADLFATDPPYLVSYDGKNHPHAWNKRDGNKDWRGSYGEVNWDEANPDSDLWDKYIKTAIECAIHKNAAWYVWYPSVHAAKMQLVWEKNGAFVHCQIIWVKDRPILTRTWYMWQHEPCLFGWIRGNKPPNCAMDHPRTIWEIPTVKPGEKTLHPTSKPVKLFEIPILQHTNKDGICYEPFLGSGSQLIACEQLDRICFGLEINPQYVQVVINRWEKFTGKKAVKIQEAA